MQTYSDFFKTLHDETSPTGYLGRGTHYSVLRAVVFHDPRGKPFPEGQGQYLNFAVIWDEDHDTRVMEPIEEIYRRGLLSSFLMFGEQKGLFTAILADKVRKLVVNDERVPLLRTQIKAICQSLNDPWSSEVVDRPRGHVTSRIARARNPIISDADEKVNLYLDNLEMLWQLGIVAERPQKPAATDMAFNPALLRKVEEVQLFSVRASNCFKNSNIVYIGDLVQKTEAEMLRTPNLARSHLNSIKEGLAQLGLHLGMDVPGWPPKDIESLARCFDDAPSTEREEASR